MADYKFDPIIIDGTIMGMDLVEAEVQHWDDQSNEDDILEHYGVLGMKWGVRKDAYVGSTGKKRAATKSTRNLSDSELRSAVNRLRLENEYKRLMTENRQNAPLAKTAKILERIATNSIDQIVTSTITANADMVLTGMGIKPKKDNYGNFGRSK